MSRKLTLSLHTAQATTSMVAMIAEAQVMVPELSSVLESSVGLMNAALERVANDIYAAMPGMERQKHPKINGKKVNGKRVRGAARIVSEPLKVKPPQAVADEPEEDWEPSSALNVSRCKRLLLEILRRAAHDWILYRQHHKMGLRELAEDAYTWLFEEGEGHPDWEERKTIEDALTSFLAICEALDFDPDEVRERVKKMDIRTIISAGRPAESRRPRAASSEQLAECGVTIDVNLDSSEDDEYESQYESYGSVMTPSSFPMPDTMPP